MIKQKIKLNLNVKLLIQKAFKHNLQNLNKFNEL